MWLFCKGFSETNATDFLLSLKKSGLAPKVSSLSHEIYWFYRSFLWSSQYFKPINSMLSSRWCKKHSWWMTYQLPNAENIRRSSKANVQWPHVLRNPSTPMKWNNLSQSSHKLWVVPPLRSSVHMHPHNHAFSRWFTYDLWIQIRTTTGSVGQPKLN